MYQTNLVRVHETRVAHHVAAIGKVDRENCAPSIADRTVAVIVNSLIAMRSDVPTGKNCFEMPQQLWGDRDYVFTVSMSSAIFNHEDSAVSFEDGGLYFSHAFTEENRDIFPAGDDLLTRLAYTQWTKRVSLSRPAKRWFRLLP